MSNCPGPERGVFYDSIVDLISRSAQVGFSLLRARYYYYRKGPVCYVLKFYSQYRYGELSISLFYILSWDTTYWVHFLPLYIDLQKICYFIMFNFKPSQDFVFLTNFGSFPLWYFWAQCFSAEKQIHNLPIFVHPQHSATTERRSTIGGRLIVVREIVTQI